MANSTYIGLNGFAVNEIDSPISPVGDLASLKKTNALSNKLTNVLSSSYADPEIRDALRLLDHRGGHNTEHARRDLKSEAQKEVIDTNGKIVDDFGQVAEQLRRVGSLIQTLNETCAHIRKHVVAAKQESGPVLEEASTLIARKQESESKQQLLAAFCTHFLISDTDLTTLTNSTEPLTERFFTVLARAKQIHKDCEILLGYENQRLGLELMEQTTRNLDAGFKKLYNWIQREFKGLDLEDPHISGSIRRALRVLSERPTLFQNCLDFFAEARENTLSDAFQAALTGNTATSTKAIEFSTHDPLRYIGDMLAWVHSAAVSEREALEGLFVSDADEISKGLSAGKASDPWARLDRRSSGMTKAIDQGVGDDVEAAFDGRKALSELVSRNLAGVGQTLQHRIEVGVRSSGDPVLIYKVYNLLTFYRDIFFKLLGPETSISKVIANLEAFVLTRFDETMEEETSAATIDNTPSSDLSPPVYLATTLKHFQDIVRARGPQMNDAELERLFTAMLSGILDSCAEGAVQLADVRRGSVYKLNYLTALRTTLRTVIGTVPSVRIPLEKANKEVQSLKDVLVNHVSTLFLEDSKVNMVLQETDARPDANDRKTWLLQNLDSAAQTLDDFLSSALMDAQDSQKHLVDRALAKEIVSEAVDRFCAEFDELESLLAGLDESMPAVDSDNTEASSTYLRDLYPRTAAEVKALLS